VEVSALQLIDNGGLGSSVGKTFANATTFSKKRELELEEFKQRGGGAGIEDL
jgi:hypothetical protein